MLDNQQATEQAGFRKGYFKIDNLHVVNQLIEKGGEYQVEMHFTFIDFKKVFDSINHLSLLSALQNQSVSPTMMNVYVNIKARIVTDRAGE